MSIQRDHLHLIVEADCRKALSNGSGVLGRVISDRFHARPLTSPRAVRNALAYCLSNWRHHGEDKAPFAKTWKVDPFSSGALFPQWQELELVRGRQRHRMPPCQVAGSRQVA